LKYFHNYSSVLKGNLGVMERPVVWFSHVKFACLFLSARKRKRTNQTQVLSSLKAHKV
jgi:hypothetical protein